MPINRRNNDYDSREQIKLTSGDLQNILEVNKKAIEIHIEVEKQNEEILDKLNYLRDKIDDIDKALFKMALILSSIGAGTVIGIIQIFLNK